MNGDYNAALLTKVKWLSRKGEANWRKESCFCKNIRLCTMLELQVVLGTKQDLKKSTTHPIVQTQPQRLFPVLQLKKGLRAQRFLSDAEMIAAVDENFQGKDGEYFFTGLKALYGKCKKCIEVKRDYIEEIHFFTHFYRHFKYPRLKTFQLPPEEQRASAITYENFQNLRPLTGNVYKQRLPLTIS